ncbi:hypothetical protein Psta_3704 [Pirellula staleyi DSM 6068]|uniref:Uncharacterized protein n=1 Tax=Pirellula staleyi (strain ATCC 27377 / DSM 6068 / ICPB 4128) TaxID=530564 RepID=D2QZZ6_PIRSD|nr:hypothetical protein [Pirellula staleyi]ADB18361.1 hypothetical protein Psta_3704 [Pirellula staleyi DSM 6068]
MLDELGALDEDELDDELEEEELLELDGLSDELLVPELLELEFSGSNDDELLEADIACNLNYYGGVLTIPTRGFSIAAA